MHFTQALVELALHDHIVVDDGDDPVQWYHFGMREGAKECCAQCKGRSRLHSSIFTLTITLDAFVEEHFSLVAHDAAEALQDDLQEDAAVGFSFWLRKASSSTSSQ